MTLDICNLPQLNTKRSLLVKLFKAILKYKFMKTIWMIVFTLFIMIGVEKSFAEDSQVHEKCVDMNATKNIPCDENFRTQSMKIFSVVDSSVGIFEDPDTGLTIVDLGSFYGVGGNGTIPDTIKVYRDDILWKTTTKETGIAPSTSHSEWQIPQTFFFNELPGKYKLVLTTNDAETLVFEFLVKQITDEFRESNLDANMKNGHMENNGENGILSTMPPLKQITNGVLPEQIICKDGLELIFKMTDNFPACVQSESKSKLIERGWAIN